MRWLVALVLFVCSAAQAALTPLPGSTPQTASLGQPFAHSIQARLTNDAGAPVSGVEVFYSMNGGGVFDYRYGHHQCVIDLGGWCSVITDADGIATVPAFGPYVAGNLTFKLSLDRAQRSADAVFELTGVAAAAPIEMQYLQGGKEIPLHGSFNVSVRVTRDGIPVAGQEVSINGNGPGVYSVGSGCFCTDANGVREVPVQSLYGIGDGELVAYAFDRLSGVSVRASTPYRVTLADGRTDFPLARLWWGGERQAGWGLYLGQSGATVFPVIFAYAPDGQPTWFTFSSVAWNSGFASTIQSKLERTSGSPFYNYDPARFGTTSLGFAQIDYKGTESLALGFDARPIAAASASMQPLQIASPASRPALGVSDLWWGGSDAAGWGMAIEEQQGSLFLVWFTYDANGVPVWYVMDEGRWSDASTWVGSIYRTTSSPMLGIRAYDPSALRRADVGSFRIRFQGDRSATFEYTLEGHAGTLQLERFDY